MYNDIVKSLYERSHHERRIDRKDEAADKTKDNGLIALAVGKYGGHDMADDIIFATREFLKVDRFLYFQVPSMVYRKGFKPTKREKIIVFSKR